MVFLYSLAIAIFDTGLATFFVDVC